MISYQCGYHSGAAYRLTSHSLDFDYCDDTANIFDLDFRFNSHSGAHAFFMAYPPLLAEKKKGKKILAEQGLRARATTLSTPGHQKREEKKYKKKRGRERGES